MKKGTGRRMTPIKDDPYRKASGRNLDGRNGEVRVFDRDGNLKKTIHRGTNKNPGWNSKWNTVK